MLILAVTLVVATSLVLQQPYIGYPFSLSLLPQRRRSALALKGRPPSVTICMSAFNEERVIRDKVDSLLAMATVYGPAELHVYVDGATDGTAAILQTYSDRARITFSQRRLGKTAGLNALVQSSASELLLFTDANVRAPPEALQLMVTAFDDPEVDCATAKLEYTNPSETGMSAAGAAYWSLEERIKGLESRSIGVVGVDGAFFMIRRRAYEAAPPHLIDDLYVSLAVLASGGHIVSVPEVIVCERSASKWNEEFRRKARIACQAINVHRTLWPRLVGMKRAKLYGYVSHRLLKWLTPFTALACGLSWVFLLCQFLPFLWIFASGCVGVGVLTGGAILGVRFFRGVVMGLLSLAGVGTGVIEAIILRKTYTVWTPASSVRD